MKKVKKIALSGIVTALIIVILSVGTLIEAAEICVAAIASFAVMLCCIELSGKYPYLVYFASAFLAILLLPNKYGALTYACFYGYYPMIKLYFDRNIKNRPLRLLLKAAVYSASFVATDLLWIYVFGGSLDNGATKALIAVTLAVSLITFAVFDFALGRLSFVYVKVWRKHIEKYLK